MFAFMVIAAFLFVLRPAFSNVIEFDSDRKIDYLIQDHYPEMILGDGNGLLGEHRVPAGNNFLTSYHQNMVSEGSNKGRQIIYNFTALDNNTEILFYRSHFAVDPVGIKASAVSLGNFEDFSFDKLLDNPCFFRKDSGEEIVMLDEDGRFSFGGMMIIKLSKGETFSAAISRTVKKGDYFSSAIEFGNNKEIMVEIRSAEEGDILFENGGTEEFNRARCEDTEPLPAEYGDLSNLGKNQVSGVFKDPNYDIKGTIIAGNNNNADESTLLVLPLADLSFGENDEIIVDCSEVEAVNEKGEKNKYCYSQNFRYILKIDNYTPSTGYEVVLIPGEGSISSYGASEPVFVYADSLDACAITYPSKVFKKDGEYYIEFNYFAVHGSSRFVYAKVLEKDR